MRGRGIKMRAEGAADLYSGAGATGRSTGSCDEPRSDDTRGVKRRAMPMPAQSDHPCGEYTSSKWAVIAKCSPDTALRDIMDLVGRGVLRKSDAGGGARVTSLMMHHGEAGLGWRAGNTAYGTARRLRIARGTVPLSAIKAPHCRFVCAAIQFASKNLSSSPRLTGCLASNLSKSSPSTSSTRRISACCLAVPLKR